MEFKRYLSYKKNKIIFLFCYLGAYNNFINAEKVNALCTILEAFGNTKTCLNSNATRMTQLLSLDFDQTGQIASASLQVSFQLIPTIV